MGWGSGGISEERLRKGRTEMERESKLGNSFFHLVSKCLLSAFSVQVIFQMPKIQQ